MKALRGIGYAALTLLILFFGARIVWPDTVQWQSVITTINSIQTQLNQITAANFPLQQDANAAAHKITGLKAATLLNDAVGFGQTGIKLNGLAGSLLDGTDSISNMNVNGWQNVMDWGAKCDDVTNDTAKINLAEVAAVTGGVGGVLYFPPNVKCLISTALNWTNLGNQTLSVVGYGAFVNCETSGVCIDGSKSNRIRVYGLQVGSESAPLAGTIGYLQGRETSQAAGGPTWHEWHDGRINMLTNAAANGGKGSAAVYIYGGEESLYDNNTLSGDDGIHVTTNNDWSIVSPYVTLITGNRSTSKIIVMGPHSSITGYCGVGAGSNAPITLDGDSSANLHDFRAQDVYLNGNAVCTYGVRETGAAGTTFGDIKLDHIKIESTVSRSVYLQGVNYTDSFDIHNILGGGSDPQVVLDATTIVSKLLNSSIRVTADGLNAAARPLFQTVSTGCTVTGNDFYLDGGEIITATSCTATPTGNRVRRVNGAISTTHTAEPLIYQFVNGQTADQVDWQNSQGANQIQIDNVGNLILSNTNVGQFKSNLVTGTAPIVVASTTPVANLTAVPTTYSIAGTQQTATHLVRDTVTLSGGTFAVTLVGSAVFSAVGNYECTCSDKTALASCDIVKASGSAFTVNGTTTDVVGVVCVGN